MPAVADELTLVVKSNVTDAVAGLDRVENKASGVGGRIAGGAVKWGARVGAVGIAAAGAVGVASAKMAMGFESSMAQIEANVGTTGKDLDKLKEAALGMGKAYGVSASEAAEGLFFLQSAGLSVEDSISALETSSKMSAMGLGEMTDIANGLTTAMTNWGISSEEAGNIVAKAVELGKAAPEEMTKILNQNAGAAAAVGVSFDDLAANSAYLTRVTGDANKAGTQMQGMLAKLIKPSQQGKKALEEMGLSIDDVRKVAQEEGMHEAIRMIGETAEEAGGTASDAFAVVFEDVNAINGAGSLWNAEMSEIEGVMSSMEDRAGKVDKGFSVIADTSEFKLGAAMESLKSALIPIGAVILDIVVPAIETLAGWLMTGVEWFQNLLGGGEELQSGLGGAFGGIMETIAGLRQWWDDHFTEIAGIVSHFQEVFQGILDDIWTFAEPLIKDMAAFFEETFGKMIDWFQENWPYIEETIHIVLDKIKAIWDIVWPYIQIAVETVWENIKTIIEAAIRIVQGIIETVMGLIRGDWDQVWEGIQNVLGGIWDGISGLVENGINAVWDTLKEVWENITGWWDGVWEDLKGGVVSIWEGIVGAIKGVINDLLGVLESGINGALTLLQKAIDAADVLAGPFINFPDQVFSPISVPRLADGGLLARGGMVKVGDAGPEVVHLPQGASVQPLRGGGGSNGASVHIEHLHSGADPHELADAIGWELMKRGI